MKKILYIVPLELDKQSGVLKKIRQQYNQWIINGAHVEVVFISSVIPHFKSLECERFYIPKKKLPLKFGKFIWRIYSIFHLRKIVSGSEFDVIYYRNVLLFPFIDIILKKENAYLELNTIDTQEVEQSSFLISKLYSKYRNLFFSRFKGVICVNEDIQKSLRHENTIVIPNGYTFSNSKDMFGSLSCRPKQFVFVSTPHQYWQGLDLIVKFASKLPSYIFNIVGWTEDDFLSEYGRVTVPNNIVFHGYLPEGKLKSVMNLCGFAINSMALFRKGMNHNSALKTGLYLNNNLPIISGYKETGIQSNSIINLNIHDEDCSIEGGLPEILDFIQFWERRNIDIDSVRKGLGIEVTESQRMSFLMSNIGSN
ncbi:hypothetical protein [Vibrio coralliirubri]|uniref:hypothetical protein n=1 Tax=Vibrio coralliirubri TaxID=1516159 RepID=UPI002FE134CE